MKLFQGNHIYRGASFDFEMLAKSVAEAAKRFNVSMYYAKKYFSGYPVKSFSEEIQKRVANYGDTIMVTPYGHRAMEKTKTRKKMTFEQFKQLVDKP